MNHVSFAKLRTNLAQFMDELCDRRDALRVTRRGGRSVVMLSEKEYEGTLETLHLLRSPANAVRLLKSIEEAEKASRTRRK
jgi:antitoxin YefM